MCKTWLLTNNYERKTPAFETWKEMLQKGFANRTVWHGSELGTLRKVYNDDDDDDDDDSNICVVLTDNGGRTTSLAVTAKRSTPLWRRKTTDRQADGRKAGLTALAGARKGRRLRHIWPALRRNLIFNLRTVGHMRLLKRRRSSGDGASVASWPRPRRPAGRPGGRMPS